jgi:putative SOS response-associated peptidase YedK
VIESFTIITTIANALVAPIHDRMPVIIDAVNFEVWLTASSPPMELRRPFHGGHDVGLPCEQSGQRAGHG